ncbi:MarR family transcriptional regulator [Microbacterium sp. 2FI]|uniref:MarR family winged helix-turn-helix transcriptional regulator n=1 Tax=Microbacterium sp. 2FI TaxID=2502193 RepID=UPI0010F855A1|nr:MarR family transcriptional regulator [Microbacterium sp. 2FI]
MSFNRFDSTGYLVNLCARLLTQTMARALRPLGIAPAQLPVLFTLSALGQSTQTELAKQCDIEQPTMALTLRRMQRDGLIERMSDPSDGRRSIVRLTPLARGLMPEVQSIANAINSGALGLTPERQQLLIELLGELAASIRDARTTDGAIARARSLHPEI